jgi:undecaprenyl-diphosphatase
MIQNFDRLVYSFLINNRVSGLNPLFYFITQFGEVWFMLIIFLCFFVFLYKKRQRILFIFLTANLVIGEILVFFLKLFFERPRPPEANALVIEPTYSFPSGHSLNAIVLYFSILIIINTIPHLFSKTTIRILDFFLISLMILVPFSRLYLGVHWFSDVAGGMILGFVIIFITYKILKINSR